MSLNEQQDRGDNSGSTNTIASDGTTKLIKRTAAAKSTMSVMEEQDAQTKPLSRNTPNSNSCGIPAPPPPSPALGAKAFPGAHSPSFFRHILQTGGAHPPSLQLQQCGVAQSQNRLHQSAPNLSFSPNNISNANASNAHFSIAAGNSTTTDGVAVPFMPNLVLHPQNNTAAITAGTMAPSSFTSSDHAVTSVMEHVLREERLRRIQKEKEEIGITNVSELRHLLREERIRSARLAAELAVQKAIATASQLEFEVSEEGRINSILRQLDTVHQEKGRIIVELEREEEMLTNTLQKQLAKVKREKELLQQQVQQEQLSHAELRNKLDAMQLSQNQDMIKEDDDEEEEDEVDDSMLPDLAAQAEAASHNNNNHIFE